MLADMPEPVAKQPTSKPKPPDTDHSYNFTRQTSSPHSFPSFKPSKIECPDPKTREMDKKRSGFQPAYKHTYGKKSSLKEINDRIEQSGQDDKLALHNAR